MVSGSRVAFLALGTRGDVQPLAVLAAEVQRRGPAVQAHVITHADHQVLTYPARMNVIISDAADELRTSARQPEMAKQNASLARS